MVDLAPLAALTGLQHINCTNTMVADLTPLVSLTGCDTFIAMAYSLIRKSASGHWQG